MDSVQTTPEEIVKILEVLARSDQEVNEQFKAHAWHIRYGITPMPKSVGFMGDAIEQAAQNCIHGPYRRTVAERLFADDRSVPLFTREEGHKQSRAMFEGLFDLVVSNAGAPQLPAELKDEFVELCMTLLKSGSVEKALGLTYDNVGSDAYEDYWRKIEIVYQFARDGGHSIDELLELPGCLLENAVTRALYTRDQYLERGNLGIERAMQSQQFLAELETAFKEKDALTMVHATTDANQGTPSQDAHASRHLSSMRNAYIMALHARARKIYSNDA